MKFFHSLALAALLRSVTTAPVELRAVSDTANEFLDGGCREVVLIFARGSTQSGNIGEMPGEDLYTAIKASLGATRVAVQGVTYTADLLDNLLPGGCNANEAASMTALITQVSTTCPSAKIIVSGYSLGAAMTHASIKGASTAVKARIVAAVTFGDTRNQQDGEAIPGFDAAKTLIICNTGDLVCEGTLIITSAHTDYTSTVPTAVAFMKSKTG